VRYHLTTFGCQMNEHDSERMKGLLESIGYSPVETRDDADLIVFNTCTIRASADDRFFGNLGEARRIKRERPDVVVAVGGCWAQSQKQQVFEQFPWVDIAFGPGEVTRLGELVARERIQAVGAFSFDGAFAASLPTRRERPYQAWVQISVGCNSVCSYCIVPSVRGRERSRTLPDVLGEIHTLAADGVREVTLLGQNVNSYGRDLRGDERTDFGALLRAVGDIDGIERLRYTSPHPKDMKLDVIAAMAETPAVCEHVHLPAQSGSTRILKAMRRTYDRGRYMDLVGRLRDAIPDLSLTTDIIVGFPGETETDFAETLSLIEECAFDGAYTFLYSPRPGTEAGETLPDDVSAETKRDRMQRLIEAVQRNGAERATRFVGSTREVLVEGPSRTDPTRLRGRLRQNITVNFTGTAQPGELVMVDITGSTSASLGGRQLQVATPA
jgi:tRNA-2-methylthio-N6-dimethylallyladenosine synthase